MSLVKVYSIRVSCSTRFNINYNLLGGKNKRKKYAAYSKDYIII